MPTLYDNLSQVRQYIDQEKPDLSSYVSNSELESMSYATTTYVADYVAEHGGGGSTVSPAFVPYTYNGYTSYISTYTYNTSSLYLDGSLALAKGNGLVIGGLDAKISGEFTMANGNNAYACADNSVALGKNASTYGWSSLAVGRSVTTWNYGEIALGIGNFSSSSSYTYTGHSNFNPGTANAYKETVFSIGGGGMNATYNTGWNRIEIRANNDIYTYGVGNYNGSNASDPNTYSLQTIINNISSFGDENLIPKENNTYTLGDLDHLYANAYTYNLSFPSVGGWLKVGDNIRINVGGSVMRPASNNFYNLGSNQYAWKDTYTNNLYLGGTNIKTTINGMFSYDSTTGTLTITTIS